MAALVCLGLGVVCAVISRVLLIAAAFSVSIWWGIGVLLPFGPLLFRLSHRDQAARSRMFGLATLPCFFGYVMLGPSLGSSLHQKTFLSADANAAPATQFAIETPRTPLVAATVTPAPTPSLDERRAANKQEIARLRTWSDKLRLTKRDLLHSDTAGNRRYNVELAQYNAAVAAANSEKAALGAK